MREFRVSAATVLWGVAFGFLAAAGIILLASPDAGGWAYLCGTTACVVTGAAAVVQIHGFCARVCGLIRAATGFGVDDDPDDDDGLRVVP